MIDKTLTFSKFEVFLIIAREKWALNIPLPLQSRVMFILLVEAANVSPSLHTANIKCATTVPESAQLRKDHFQFHETEIKKIKKKIYNADKCKMWFETSPRQCFLYADCFVFIFLHRSISCCSVPTLGHRDSVPTKEEEKRCQAAWQTCMDSTEIPWRCTDNSILNHLLHTVDEHMNCFWKHGLILQYDLANLWFWKVDLNNSTAQSTTTVLTIRRNQICWHFVALFHCRCNESRRSSPPS